MAELDRDEDLAKGDPFRDWWGPRGVGDAVSFLLSFMLSFLFSLISVIRGGAGDMGRARFRVEGGHGAAAMRRRLTSLGSRTTLARRFACMPRLE